MIAHRKVNNMREKLMRFMMGRYGLDSLGRCTIFAALILMISSSFFDSVILSLLSWALAIYTYFRIFSKNIYKRASENQAFTAKTYGLRRWFSNTKSQMAQRKTHHIYHCPSCRQKIRIPRKKGTVEIRCPKCSTCFVKKT